jgi:hypothetical protein
MRSHGIRRSEVENLVGCYVEDIIEKEGPLITALNAEAVQAFINEQVDNIEAAAALFAQSLKA